MSKLRKNTYCFVIYKLLSLGFNSIAILLEYMSYLSELTKQL